MNSSVFRLPEQAGKMCLENDQGKPVRAPMDRMPGFSKKIDPTLPIDVILRLDFSRWPSYLNQTTPSGNQDCMPKIRLATVLPGAVGFSEGNINHTYRGQILLEDGVVRIAILKDLEIKELANELLALVLAQSLGLPVPDGYLALVRGSDLDVKKGPSLGDGSRLVFASADVKVPNVTFQLISAAFEGQKILYQGLASWGQLGNLYAFDTWTANIDRHPGNILFGGESEIWVIDHGWCYTGPNWQVIDLIAEGQYTNRLSDWLTVHLTDDQKTQSVKQAAIFNEGIAKIDLSAATRNSYLEALVSPADAAGLKSFLAIRIQSVIVHTNRALGVPSLL